jgi:FkbM family methyltransferase
MMYQTPDTCQIENLSDIYIKYFGYPSKGYFVEVGAYDGDFVSNTSCLADHGWGGLYIEPIEQHYLKCLRRHDKNDVTVANVAIGLEEGETKIYYGDTLTTLDREQMERYREIDWAQHIRFSETVCDQMRLDTLMEKVDVPKEFDVLVVDVEGKEAEVFKTFELDEWKPKMLIVELEDEHHSFQKYEGLVNEIKELREYIKSKGYVEIFKDYINTVFVREELKK